MKTEKTLRHWLHIILSLLTGGLWLAVYGILIAVNEMNNRVVRGYNQGWKDAHVSVEPRNMGMSWQGEPMVQALHRSSVGIPQAALTAEEAEEYRELHYMPLSGMSEWQRSRYDELRSRFK